jgi:urease subunit gamma/beta
MHLGPRELDKLMLHQACFLAQKRLARGLLLNYTESVALISGQLLELIRDGKSVAELMDMGKNFLGLSDVMPGVKDMIHEVQVEGTFPDGTKLVTVHDPICHEKGQTELALYGSGLSFKKEKSLFENFHTTVPGEKFVQDGELEINKGRKTISLNVLNTGDRPVQVGSHYPFMESNRALKFDRKASYGFRLDIPAGTAVRFEPGESKEVQMVEFSGHQIYKGGNAMVQEMSEHESLDDLMEKMKAEGFQFSEAGDES